MTILHWPDCCHERLQHPAKPESNVIAKLANGMAPANFSEFSSGLGTVCLSCCCVVTPALPLEVTAVDIPLSLKQGHSGLSLTLNEHQLGVMPLAWSSSSALHHHAVWCGRQDLLPTQTISCTSAASLDN